jgi:uncharacterized protein YkwD
MGHHGLTLVFAIESALRPRAASAQAAEPRTAGGQSPDLVDVVERLISRTHAFHQDGRPPVAPNPERTAAAPDVAPLMARTDRLSHAADGKTPAERAKVHGDDACLIAEHMASQQHPVGCTAEALAQGCFQGWQHSPSHRGTLLDPAVTATGLGVAQREQTGASAAVQLCGRPTSQPIAFQLTNTSNVAIQDTIDGQMCSLPPQATSTPQQCRPPKGTFHGPGTQGQKAVPPDHGDHETLVRGDAGACRVAQG